MGTKTVLLTDTQIQLLHQIIDTYTGEQELEESELIAVFALKAKF